MFWVLDIFRDMKVMVYAVKTEDGKILFLFYEDPRWIWADSRYCKPVVSEE